ncbi:ABC transporter permease [Streptomyces albipurpureus]|uniref:ABC transporter permease n=1 Tax=Streptomyces albipurpureus TaxID=2897419 RepID=A0ABT0UTE7_9ACTN|nr:ABC transporter permease [Streptomyces sp. CWNU-1]MCM2390506.1 ABC transporter permease [Streptomyces sp. CWNU-1]
MPDTLPSSVRAEEAHAAAVAPRPNDDPARRVAAAVRSLVLPVVVAVAVGAIFISVYLSAFHAPVARDLPVAVVGSAAQAAGVQDRLPERPSDTFSVRAVEDAQAARSAVQHGEVFAAYIPEGGAVTLLYAGAHGPSVTALLLDELGEVAHEGGQSVEAVDILPASPQDTRGLAVFYTTFGLVLAGYLFGIMTYQLAPGVSMARRLVGLAAFGVAGGLAVASVVSAFGALPAPFFGVAGLVALVALAVSASTMFLVRALGVMGSSAAAVVFMTVGNATSGGSLPAEFLPSWLEPFSSVLPVGVGVRAVNGLAYFHGEGVLSGVTVLTAWIAAGVGGLLLLERARGRARRSTLVQGAGGKRP